MRAATSSSDVTRGRANTAHFNRLAGVIVDLGWLAVCPFPLVAREPVGRGAEDINNSARACARNMLAIVFADLRFSQFKSKDEGALYAFYRESFLKQRPVHAPGAGSLGAGIQRQDHVMVGTTRVAHLIREYDANVEHRGMKVMTTEAGTYNVEALGAHQVGSFNAYHLPWASNCTYHMTLGGAYGSFFTAPMNGCAMMIRGSRTAPTVYHANYQLGEDAPELVGLSDSAMI